MCQEVSHMSAEVKVMLRLLLNPSTNNDERIQSPAARVTRRDRAATFRRGFSETSDVERCYSPKSRRPISANHRPLGILKISASASKPLTHRVDFVQRSRSQQQTVDKDNEAAVKNHHVSTDVDNSTQSSPSNVVPASAAAAVRMSQPLLRSSTIPDFIQHHTTSLVSADGQRPQALLTTSTMKRVEKFRRRAAAASTTTLVTGSPSSAVTTTDL